MENSSVIGNRARDLPACNAVPQPTAKLRAPNFISKPCISVRFLLHDIEQCFSTAGPWHQL